MGGLYEDQLLEMQGNELARQNKSLKDMQPFMLESLGLRRNASGMIERIPDISTQDPFLSRFKSDQMNRLKGTYTSPQMEEGLLKWAGKMPVNTNTQAKEEYDRNAAILREGINRGGLESGANLLSQREGLLSNLKARDTDRYKNTSANDLQLLSGIGSALQPYMALREQQFSRDLQDEQNRANKKAATTQTVVSTVVTIIAAAV